MSHTISLLQRTLLSFSIFRICVQQEAIARRRKSGSRRSVCVYEIALHIWRNSLKAKKEEPAKVIVAAREKKIIKRQTATYKIIIAYSEGCDKSMHRECIANVNVSYFIIYNGFNVNILSRARALGSILSETLDAGNEVCADRKLTWSETLCVVLFL
jgi:hypothetical protein